MSKRRGCLGQFFPRPPTPPTGLPLYVDDNLIYPPPYTCTGVEMFAFVFKGDKKKIRQFVDERLNLERGQTTRYYVPSSYVLMTFASMNRVVAGEPYSERGWFKEAEVTFWVLTFGMKQVLGQWVVDVLHPAFFVPYIFVDNPISIAGGREIYGFSKHWGQLEMPNQAGPLHQPLTLDVFGLKTFSPDTEAIVQRLLTVTPSTAVEKAETPEWTSFDDAFNEFEPELSDDASSDIKFPQNLFKFNVPLVFLKQFRAAQDNQHACYQGIVETTGKISRLALGRLKGNFNLTIEPMAMMPIAETLGITDQESRFSLWVDMDMTVQQGHVVWSSTGT